MGKSTEFDTLIVYCHPYDMSLNAAVLTAVEEGLDRAGRTFEVCDLYSDGFDPVLHAGDLELYNEGKTTDELVRRYQKALLSAKHLVLVTPIWWNDVPALLKGWLDKVMLVGFSWEATGHGLEGTLGRAIESVDVFTTSAEPTEHLRAAIEATLFDGTFAQLGIARRAWHNFGGMDQSTVEQREAWLAEVTRTVAGEVQAC
ncbi:NAD(P)H-dependent oxidoreductase [Paratractidigestivibacter sp.]|uniref:NAD(P)H-dependent oxidoreductase n=1 Tax=Paratractidigestivibacter sp. TaxID=2847316 RepID=UPI004026B502